MSSDPPEKDVHILIVEDDELVSLAMHEFMKISGYKVSMALSAEKALELLETEDIHVVITDIMLPGMDGLRMTERIRKRYETGVIVITGYSGDYSYEDAIEKGASDFVFKPVRLGELLLRVRRVIKEQQLKKERDRILNKLETLAITDDLTKVYNLRYFYKHLKSEIDRSERYRHPLSVLFMDIDRFKQFNDTYGHLEGDRMLARVAEILRSTLRQTDSVCRYGGDEFTAILPETAGDEAKVAVRRIIRALSGQEFVPDTGEAFHITISSGIAEYHPGEDVASLIRRADQAMFLSKQKGRNQITFLRSEEDLPPSCKGTLHSEKHPCTSSDC